jgi:hypothetical protein
MILPGTNRSAQTVSNQSLLFPVVFKLKHSLRQRARAACLQRLLLRARLQRLLLRARRAEDAASNPRTPSAEACSAPPRAS